MRLSADAIQTIRHQVCEVCGEAAQVRLFGSRTDPDGKGGDIDLLVELTESVEHPALVAARLSARISRALDGRQVDVVLAASNLRRLPIHEHARATGILL